MHLPVEYAHKCLQCFLGSFPKSTSCLWKFLVTSPGCPFALLQWFLMLSAYLITVLKCNHKTLTESMPYLRLRILSSSCLAGLVWFSNRVTSASLTNLSTSWFSTLSWFFLNLVFLISSNLKRDNTLDILGQSNYSVPLPNVLLVHQRQCQWQHELILKFPLLLVQWIFRFWLR